MSNLNYNQFYMMYGVRNRSLLSNPKAFNIENFSLPRNSIVHYLPENAADLGPDETYFVFQKERVRPYAHNVVDMTNFAGNPRKRGGFNMTSIVKSWMQKRRGFRRVPDINRALDDKNVAILANYALIPMQWRYLPVPLTRYYRFQNILATAYKQAKFYTEHSDRQQFIVINIPDILPTKMQFNISVEDGVDKEVNVAYQRYLDTRPATGRTYRDVYDIVNPGLSDELPIPVANEAFDESSLGFESLIGGDNGSFAALEEMNRIRLGYFHDDSSLFLQDLWQWLSPNRANSLLSIYPNDRLDYLNIVFHRMGKWTVLNLGKLNSWALSEENPKGDAFNQISRYVLQHLTSVKLLTGVQEQAIIEETLPDEETGESQIIDVTGLPDDAEVELPVNSQNDDESQETTSTVNKITRTVKEIRDSVNAGEAGVKTQLINAFKSLTETEETTEPVTTVRLLAAPDIDLEINVEPQPEEQQIDPRINGVVKAADDLLEKGLISRAEYKRHVRLAESFKVLPAPFDDTITLEEFSVIPKETVWDFKPTEVPDIKNVKDKSMLKSTLIDFDKKYVSEVMQKDVLNLVLNLQKAGIAVTDYKVERQTDALNDLYEYTVKLSPVKGTPSTVRFQLPVIDKNGKYRVSGIKYYMRKLRFDKPIRKISPSVVALSTYYGKLFVERSDKKRNDYGAWLIEKLYGAALENPPRITDVVYGTSFSDSQPVPRTYSAIAKEVISFKYKGITLTFDFEKLNENFPEWDGTGDIPVGKVKSGLLVMDKEGFLHAGSQHHGHISTLFGAVYEERPDELVTITVLGEEFPLGIVLSYLEGLTALTETLEIKPTRRVKGTRVANEPNTFDIVFADEIWRLPRVTHPDILIYQSLTLWAKVLKKYTVAELDNRDNYGALLSDMALSGRYIYEFGNLNNLFIDPIAEENLAAMNEPTEFIPLLKKAAFYLATDNYPSDLSTEGSLFKGYERMAGAVYRGFSEAVRRFSSGSMGSRSTIDFPPFEILANIQKDPSVSLVEDSNPIHNLKEKENFTYTGTGGRGKRSMTRRTRAFHKTDVGVRSEASVDSGDVGINCFLTANPNITSLRGTAVPELDPKAENGAGNLLSTSALISPFSTFDDPKRVSFIGIQSSHKIASVGDQLSPIRTGYELMTAHRTDDLFSSVAKGPGVITEKGKNYVIVKYDDESFGEERIEIGRRFGIVTGHTVPHEIVCDLDVNTRVDTGNVIAYNSGFFERDWRDTKQVAQKAGVQMNIVLMENNETFEDASLISLSAANKLKTTVTHTRTLLVNFNQAIRNLVNEGQVLDSEDILAFIEDEVSARFDLFDESSADILKRLGNPAPRAKDVGKVEKIEVFYFGDKEDMSKSVREIADKYDRQRAKNNRILGIAGAETGQIFAPSRIDGMQLEIDMMAIRIYITHGRGMGDGDKLVVGNQKKSVVSGVYTGICRTATPVFPGKGKMDIDLQFSYRAVNARIVNSALLLGMGNILIENIQLEMLKAYDS